MHANTSIHYKRKKIGKKRRKESKLCIKYLRGGALLFYNYLREI